MIRLSIRRLDPTLQAPSYARPGDAGLDLRVLLDGAMGYDYTLSPACLRLYPGGRVLLRTGLAVAIPPGYQGEIRPRSSLFFRGLHAAHGTIDAGYRGELKIAVANLGLEPIEIEPGERLAQLVVAPVARCEVVEVEELEATARGEGGFGSTGRA
jgi:dUTP pyrophosphatase